MSYIYRSRKERAKYVYYKSKDGLRGNILDVGCGDAYLREYAQGSYVGIDIAGKPDILFNLEGGNLPFRDNIFDTVICTDTLEHLENIHRVFLEMTRVTKQFVILSLPNNWRTLLPRLLRGKGNLKFYGLPVEKPIDRHRWFFNYEDAKNFIYKMANKTDMKVISCEPYLIHTQKGQIMKSVLKFFYRGDRYYNLFANALWAVLEKKNACTRVLRRMNGKRLVNLKLV